MNQKITPFLVMCTSSQVLAFAPPLINMPSLTSSTYFHGDNMILTQQGTQNIATGRNSRARIPTVVFERNGSVMESGEMILAKDNRLLDMAFSALDDKDKYETVLTGLCAKVIDGGAATATAGLVDPIRLIEEMNSNGIVAGQRGIISLIDAAALTSDARVMANVLSLAIKNGALYSFGCLQGEITPFPRAPASPFTFGNQNNKLVEKLQSLPAVPDDDRAAEVSSALAFSAVVAVCVGVNVFGGLFGLDDLTPITNLILGIAVTTVIVDNFFDVLVMGGSTVAKLNEDKLPDAAKNMNAPKKEDMPLGIGTGSLTGTVARGLSRLLSVNTERDCQCEAAAIFVAYALGLPCFAFQPNSLEGAALVIDSMREESSAGGEYKIQGQLDYLATDAGLLKVLMWLIAPVAMESGKYPQLISSDPSEARVFLDRLNEKSNSIQFAKQALEEILPEDDAQSDDYLKWALSEADTLLRNNKKVVDNLSEALAGGAATIGDCVAILEGW